MIYTNPDVKDSEKVVMKTDRPIDRLILKPDDPLLKPPAKMTYVYYNSNGALTRVNQDDPSDKTVISRPGGSFYFVDPKNNDLFYVVFNRAITKEDLETGDSKNIVSGWFLFGVFHSLMVIDFSWICLLDVIIMPTRAV